VLARRIGQAAPRIARIAGVQDDTGVLSFLCVLRDVPSGREELRAVGGAVRSAAVGVIKGHGLTVCVLAADDRRAGEGATLWQRAPARDGEW
jgi:hypothetical protein